MAIALTLIPPGSLIVLVGWGNRLHPFLLGYPFLPVALIVWTIGTAFCLYGAHRLV